MKKLFYLIVTALCVLSCNTSDDEQIKTEEPTVTLPDVPGVPLPPNRGFNIDYVLFIRFENENGENIFDEQNPLMDYNQLQFEIYGANGYYQEFPHSVLSTLSDCVEFYNSALRASVFKVTPYYHKTETLQQLLGERKWEQYRVTFPDGTPYVIKIEGDFRGTNIDLQMYKVFVNDELIFDQSNSNELTSSIGLTLVK